jgi:hypothetical protein
LCPVISQVTWLSIHLGSLVGVGLSFVPYSWTSVQLHLNLFARSLSCRYTWLQECVDTSCMADYTILQPYMEILYCTLILIEKDSISRSDMNYLS